MLSYREWMIGEGKVKLYEIYLKGPGIDPQTEKAIKAVKGIVPNPKSFLVLKFRGTKEELSKVESALEEVNYHVVDVEIEHD